MSKQRPPEFPYQVSPGYERFNQKYVIFSRWIWDEKIRGWKEGLLPRPVERIVADDRGYGLLDYALRSGGWYLDGFNDTVSAIPGDWNLYAPFSLSTSHSSLAAQPWNGDPELERVQREFKAQSGPRDLTKAVKRAARFLGADLVGVASYDERWVYSHTFLRKVEPSRQGEVVPLEMPPGVTSVVVLAFEMEYGALNTSPAALAMAATGLGYSRMAFVTSSLAEFIHSLGYWAQPCGNDTALSVPLAIAAGLGEVGRQGLLVTREYGPRVRLSKIFTDMPLVGDEPVSFGVWEFCKGCKKCAERCPPRAISFDDEPSWEGPNISNNPGVLKWYVNPEKCFRFWCQNGWSCSNCQASCPYNKDYSRWYHRVARGLAPRLGSFALWLDDLLGYGKQASTEEWWAFYS